MLGPPTVTVDGVDTELRGRQVLLALRLALGRGRPVSSARLLEAWPDEGSPGALRVALTRLRRVLGESVVRTIAGYLIDPRPELDADEFERHVTVARSPALPIDRRRSAVAAGLALWTGPAFDGVEALEWVEAEVVRLDEMYEQLVDLGVELELACGDARPVLDEIRAAVERRPLREGRVGLLATALYRCERQTEALRAIADLRRRLAEEVGLDLGPRIRELEQRILAHDESLLAPTTSSGESSLATDGEPGSRELRDGERAGGGQGFGDGEDVARRDDSAVDSKVRAARALAEVGAVDEAVSIATDAVSDARALPEERAETLIRTLLAQAAIIAQSGSRPTEQLEEVRQLARSRRDGHSLARAALIGFGSGIPTQKSEPLVELSEPLSLLPPDAPERIELLCAAAVVIGVVDAGSSARRLVEAAEETDAVVRTPRSEVAFLAAKAIVAAVDADASAHLDDISEWSRRALLLARRDDDPLLVTVALQAVLRATYMRGALDEIDAVLPELETSSRRSGTAFGLVRVHLCAATNALARGDLAGAEAAISSAEAVGARLETNSAAGSTGTQRLLLAREYGADAELLAVLRARASGDRRLPTIGAIAAFGDRDDVRAVLDVFPAAMADVDRVGAALATLGAARHRDVEVARRCLDELIRVCPATITAGFGSVVIGFASHFVGLAQLAIGDRRSGEASLVDAAARARHVGATAWWADSTLARLEAAEYRDSKWFECFRELGACDVVTHVPRLATRFAALDGDGGRSATAS